VNSSVIGKIEKARVYAGERHRIHFDNLRVTFHGDNDDHTVTLQDEQWSCSCDFFGTHGTCAHSMAMERVLEGMIPDAAATQLQHA